MVTHLRFKVNVKNSPSLDSCLHCLFILFFLGGFSGGTKSLLLKSSSKEWWFAYFGLMIVVTQRSVTGSYISIELPKRAHYKWRTEM